MDNRQNKEIKTWDKIASNYDSFVKKMFDKTYNSILENIDIELKANDNVLEIGTGTGIISFSIYSKVSSIIASDLSPEMVSIAKQKQKDSNIENIDFQIQDSYNLTFADRSFDIVIASNLFHLLYDPAKPINEVKRVMKDSGVFIVPTFCVGENIKSRIIDTVGRIFFGFKIVNKWSIEGFKSMLTNNGLLIKKALKIEGRFPLAYVVLKKK
jgi:ubiquinone/menaquinone biosynthesis C-methylase UbiE